MTPSTSIQSSGFLTMLASAPPAVVHAAFKAAAARGPLPSYEEVRSLVAGMEHIGLGAPTAQAVARDTHSRAEKLLKSYCSSALLTSRPDELRDFGAHFHTGLDQHDDVRDQVRVAAGIALMRMSHSAWVMVEEQQQGQRQQAMPQRRIYSNRVVGATLAFAMFGALVGALCNEPQVAWGALIGGAAGLFLSSRASQSRHV